MGNAAQMTGSAALIGFLVLAVISESQWSAVASSYCNQMVSTTRPHSVTITEFGAVGDGVTLNTKAFHNAIFYLNSFADKGGAQLFVPAGRWLTGSFSLISHLTLSLDKDAVILGSTDPSDWPVIDPLPSYGRGRELPGGRHQSLIHGYNLTDVVITDSSSNVCIEDCYISTGDDLIVIKSGWDEFGISFAHPSVNISIRGIIGETGLGSGIAFGSEMSGGISDVEAEDIHLFNSMHGIRIKTAPGRGGYVRNLHISGVTMTSVKIAIRITGQYGEHPDDNYDPAALPTIQRITIRDVVGENISVAGILEGMKGSIFRNICLSNVVLDVTSKHPWNCSNIQGFSNMVVPESCKPLREDPDPSSACYKADQFSPRHSVANRLIPFAMFASL